MSRHTKGNFFSKEDEENYLKSLALENKPNITSEVISALKNELKALNVDLDRNGKPVERFLINPSFSSDDKLSNIKSKSVISNLSDFE